MADWKQITARIRRAKGSKDPAGQLCNLFQKTRDAMVAFELARHLEVVQQPDDASKWYAISWQRFRRNDWKTKAQEALTRLGGATPGETDVLEIPEIPLKQAASEVVDAASSETPADTDSREPEQETEETPAAAPQLATDPEASSANGDAKRRRRRGRRGGRNRRKPETVGAKPPSAGSSTSRSAAPAREEEPTALEIPPPRVVDSRAIPKVPVEAMAEASGGVRGRFGDPGLSSRLSLLEMQFRRLLSCTPVKLDQCDKAPAGPGVFVLTDDEMTTYYHVEACDTLRIAIGHLSRGGANRRTGVNIKAQLAEHLEIPDTRAAKYLADHCVVRWLQLDEGAEHFAHFAIAVLRPVLSAQD